MRARLARLGLALAACLTSQTVTCEETGGEPDLVVPWATLSSGGSSLRAGGQFLVSGTVGQHDAGGIRSGGVFLLRGGFWYAPFASIDVMFFDGFEEATAPTNDGVRSRSDR